MASARGLLGLIYINTGILKVNAEALLKIIMDADCFSRHGWRCYIALAGVFSQKKLPSLKSAWMLILSPLAPTHQ
jgi:hypothetical protein